MQERKEEEEDPGRRSVSEWRKKKHEKMSKRKRESDYTDESMFLFIVKKCWVPKTTTFGFWSTIHVLTTPSSFILELDKSLVHSTINLFGPYYWHSLFG